MSFVASDHLLLFAELTFCPQLLLHFVQGKRDFTAEHPVLWHLGLNGRQGMKTMGGTAFSSHVSGSVYPKLP